MEWTKRSVLRHQTSQSLAVNHSSITVFLEITGFKMRFSVLSLAALTASVAVAHPGEKQVRTDAKIAAAKREFKAGVRRGLEACSGQLSARGVTKRAISRRAATAQKYGRSVEARDTDAVLNTSHLSTANYTLDTPESTLFANSGTCAVNPEGETGPYWVRGELIRNNLREEQAGVPIVIEAQFVDVETCEPLEGVYW